MTILDSQLANRVWETTLTTGTGPVTLAGARTGFRRFEDAIDDGPTSYFIASASLAAWEVGLGTFTAPNALSRDTVLTSSNGGALVNFIAGSKDVVLDVPSELLDALVAADATEAAARIAAVLAEATARSNADSAESTARGNADTALQGDIDDEEAARIAADLLFIPLTQKGAANGVASLDGTGKVPTAQLPIAAALGSVTYQGTWNATSNTPTIPAAVTGNKGYYYRVATAGTTTIDGVSDWKVGDWIVSDGAIWQKVDNTDPAGVSDVPGLVTVLGLKADQTALDSEETDRIAGDDTLQAEIDAIGTGGQSRHYGAGAPPSALGVPGDSYLDVDSGDEWQKISKANAWAWSAAGSASPAIAAKAKALMPGWDGSGNPVELVSGEQFQLNADDNWVTKNGLTGINFTDYTDGSAPGSDTTGRPLTSASFALKIPCVLWGLISVPTVQADPVWGGLILHNFSNPGGGLFSQSYIPNTSGAPLFLGGVGQWWSKGNDADRRGIWGRPDLIVPGALLSVVTVLTPTGQDNLVYINGVLVPGLEQVSSPEGQFVNTGTVTAGDAVINPETPHNLGYAYAQEHTDADPSTFVPGMDRWVTHANAVLEDLTEDEVAEFLVDPAAVMRQAGADVTLEESGWVRVAELATQAELDAEATTRGAAVTTLQGRATALEATAPTANQKLALAGTGTPSGTDKYVNDSDARMTDARTPTAHSHPESEVTSLVTDLAAKATTVALSSEASARGAADTTLQSNIDAEASARSTADALLIPLTQKAAASGVATLDSGGKVPSAQLPAVALVKPVVVADLAARLALTAQAGDVAVQTDTTKTYMLKEAGDPTVDADWIELKAPSGGAPAGSPYVTFGTDATLSNERVVTDTPTVAWDVGTAGQLKANVPDDGISYAKIQNVSATDKLLGRATAGAGDVEEIALTAAGRALIDDAAASDQRTTLGLGALAVLATVGTTQIDNDAVTNAKLANMANATVKGRSTAGTGDPEDLPLGAGLTLSGGTLYGPASDAVQGLISGAYYTGRHSGSPATTTWANGRLIVHMIPLAKGGTIDQVAFEVVTTGGGTGSVHRVGIWRDNGSGYPGALVVDLGTVATTTTGTKTIAVSPSQVLAPGIYWVGVVQQGAPSPAATIRYGNFSSPHHPIVGGTVAQHVGGLGAYDTTSGITGALPDPFTAGTTPTGNCPRVFVRGA